jgi:hypothetical protein
MTRHCTTADVAGGIGPRVPISPPAISEPGDVSHDILRSRSEPTSSTGHSAPSLGAKLTVWEGRTKPSDASAAYGRLVRETATTGREAPVCFRPGRAGKPTLTRRPAHRAASRPSTTFRARPSTSGYQTFISATGNAGLRLGWVERGCNGCRVALPLLRVEGGPSQEIRTTRSSREHLWKWQEVILSGERSLHAYDYGIPAQA